MQRILVGLDGSPESLAALAWAGDLAQSLNLEIDVVAVYGLNPTVLTQSLGAYPTDEMLAQEAQEVQSDCDQVWTKPLRDAGVKLTTHFEQGDPATVLLAYARDLPADLIVVGCHGYGLVRELFLGSVSHQLVLRSPCPVVVLPHPHPHSGDVAR